MIARPAMLALIAVGLSGCRTVVWYGASPGRTHRVQVVERLGRQRVVVDGGAGTAYDAVGIAGLTVLDGGASAYAARRGGTWRVVWNGREGAGWDAVGELVLSDGGAHLAYAARRERAWRVVVDGRPGPAFDAIFARTIRLSRGGRVAYVGERGGRSHVVIGERVWPASDGVSGLALSRSGAHVGWLERCGDAQRAVVDGDAGPWWDEARDLVVRDDGAAALAARRAGAWWLSVGPELRGPYDGVSRVQEAPDGSLVHVVRERGEERVVGGGHPHAPVDAVLELATDDAGRVGFIGRRGQVVTVFVDGTQRAVARHAAGLVLGPRGRWAFVAADLSGIRVVHDLGEDVVAGAVPDTLAFSPTGRWGVVARDPASGGMAIVPEGGGRLRIDAEEVAAAAMRLDDPAGLSATLRAWIAAEVARAR